MIHVFYKKESGQILGFSDRTDVFDHPYVDTEEVPTVLSNYYVDISGQAPELKLIKESFTDEEWEKIVNPPPVPIVVDPADALRIIAEAEGRTIEESSQTAE